MNKHRRNDPESSVMAAERSTEPSKIHRDTIRSCLKQKPRQTAYELMYYIQENHPESRWLTYHQIMRRLKEVAWKGEIIECATGKPCCRVAEWSLNNDKDN